MTPEEKLAWRHAYATNAKVVHESLIHEHHDQVASYRLRVEGIKPELLAYLEGLRRHYA